MNQTYPRLTVDPVLFVFDDNKLKVMLVTRPNEPEKGKWALPGGQSFEGQLTKDVVQQCLKDKSGVQPSQIDHIEQLHAFDTLGLDDRGHAVTITYLLLAREVPHESILEGAQLFDVHELPELAFDHISIVRKGLERLSERLEKTTIASRLLPKELTLNQLYWLYSAAEDLTLDNRNFRKKFLSFNVLKDTGRMQTGVSHRPSKLYTFSSSRITDLVETIS